MTSPEKSKRPRVFTAFLVCGFSLGVAQPLALAQSAQSGPDGFNELRGTIAGSGARTTDGLDLNTSDGQRAQLNRSEPVQTAPSPLPLSPRVQQRALPASSAPVVFNPQSADQLPQQNIAAEAVQDGTAAVFEDEPFAPTGFRIGTFEGNASLEQSIGYSSNVSQVVNGNGGAFSQTDVFLDLTSNWSRHQLQGAITGSYFKPLDSDEIERPLLNATTSLRLDLLDGYTLTTSGFYTIQTQDFTSSTIAPGSVDTPQIDNFGGSVELQRTDRKLQLTLRGSIDRNVFADAEVGGGLTVSQEDLNNTEYGLALRVGYEISPAFTPFIEGQYALREFDQAIDRNGNRRDSDIMRLRGGLEVDLGEKLTGQIALGVVNEVFEDAALQDLSGFTIDGQLSWSPERDTLINLTLGTQSNSSITPGDSGSIIYNARLDAERQISNRWSLNGFVDYQVETNDDQNTTLGIGIGTEYWVNRFMALTSDLEYSSFTSGSPGSDFDELSGRLGVRLQR